MELLVGLPDDLWTTSKKNTNLSRTSYRPFQSFTHNILRELKWIHYGCAYCTCVNVVQTNARPAGAFVCFKILFGPTEKTSRSHEFEEFRMGGCFKRCLEPIHNHSIKGWLGAVDGRGSRNRDASNKESILMGVSKIGKIAWRHLWSAPYKTGDRHRTFFVRMSTMAFLQPNFCFKKRLCKFPYTRQVKK